MVVPFILALGTTWAIHHFFFSPKETVQQYEFSAPQSKNECQPLDKTVSFAPFKCSAGTIYSVETSWGELEFSTNGAALSRLTFKRDMHGNNRLLTTVFPYQNLENSAFLIAFDEATPYHYTHEGTRDAGSTIQITFAAESEKARIVKTFVVFKELHQVDLQFTITPKHGSVLPRILYPAPLLPELKDQQLIAGDVLVGARTFKKEARESIKSDSYWVKPTLFGVENKFFVHALVNDVQGFVNRAYFNKTEKDQLQAIVEGAPIEKETSWNVSFYVGPKELTAMEPIDPRLEETLEYSGWWAPISRVLLKLLNWLNHYVHNYGWAIIILTALIRLLMLPFSLRAKQGLKDRAEMQKKLQYIQQKYKDDPQARAQAQAEFMQKHGFGLSGCLPLLVQIPIFFGLSKVLSSSIELYQAPFLWITDLSARDPYYILPLCVAAGIIIKALSSKDASQRMPLLVMGLVFGAFSATLPAGLVLYIAIGSVLNVT